MQQSLSEAETHQLQSVHFGCDKVWKSKGPLTLFCVQLRLSMVQIEKITRSPIVFEIGSCQEMRETTIGCLASFRRTPSAN